MGEVQGSGMIAGLLLTAAVHAVAPTGAVVVRGEVPQVVVLAGDVRVEGRVTGNLVVLLGDVELAGSGKVDGDLVVLGGSVAGSGAVGGRTWVVGGRGPALGRPASWNLIRLGLWLVLSFLLVVAFPRGTRGVGGVLGEQPLAAVAGGLGFLLVWFAVAMFVGVAVGGGVQLLLWAFLSGVLVAVKAFGLVGLAWAVGSRLRGWLPVAFRGEFPRTGVAMASFVVLSWAPWVGPALWVVANVAGVGGATLWIMARGWLSHAVSQPSRP